MKHFFRHSLARDLVLDSPQASKVHAQIIREKPFLKKLYESWYRMIADDLPLKNLGPVVEIGSGGGFLNTLVPRVISTEIHCLPWIKVALDARNIPFRKNTISAIVMVDVLHHIPDVKKFLKEAMEVLQPGGRILMIEPWVSLSSRFIFKYLHHEPFEPEAVEWEFPEGGPLSQSNQALPWIVFQRDIELFHKYFSRFRIKKIIPHSPFCYLLSGGLTYRSPFPGSWFPFFNRLEKILNYFPNIFSMFVFIHIIKENRIKNGVERVR